MIRSWQGRVSRLVPATSGSDGICRARAEEEIRLGESLPGKPKHHAGRLRAGGVSSPRRAEAATKAR